VGETEHLLLLQDRMFDTKGALVYPSDPMALAMGVEGDTTLVNLTAHPTLPVGTRLYRFRVLNGSNATIYRLAFARRTTGALLPLQVIGTDGGLLDHPYPATDCFLAPAERIDLLLDLASLAPGEVVMLRNLAFDPMHHEIGSGEEMMGEMGEMGIEAGSRGEMGGMAGMEGMLGTGAHDALHSSHATQGAPSGQASVPSSGEGEGRTQEVDLLQLVVQERVSYDRAIPSALSLLSPLTTDAARTRPFTLSSAMTDAPAASGQIMQWLINGLTYQLDEDPITVQQGTTEIWAMHNEAQSMPHPMHLHGFVFQVLDRTNSPEQVRRLAVDAQGRTVTDLGWKDTVLVWPGETVRIAITFAHPFGSAQRYVFHCHILEHEDNGMMLNFRVEE
jgi:blue copper oxidase